MNHPVGRRVHSKIYLDGKLHFGNVFVIHNKTFRKNILVILIKELNNISYLETKKNWNIHIKPIVLLVHEERSGVEMVAS